MQAEIEQTRLRVKQEMLKEIEIAKAEAHHEIKSQKKQYEEVVQNLQSQLVLYLYRSLVRLKLSP